MSLEQLAPVISFQPLVFVEQISSTGGTAVSIANQAVPALLM